MLGGDEVEQDIGAVLVGEPEEADGIRFTPVDVGNPHAVVEGNPDDLPDIGPRLETHPRFPQRTNVQVARIDAPGHVTARVWERGVGETRRPARAPSRWRRRRMVMARSSSPSPAAI